jgi:AraC-like DNA-binding protein
MVSDRSAAAPGDDEIAHGAFLGRSIGASHLSWKFDTLTTRNLSGTVTSRSVGPLRLSWIRLLLGSQRWSGERGATDICANPEPYLIVLMPLEGSIQISSPNRAVTVGPHELAIWDSTQPITFRIAGDRYAQISVLIPQRTLRASREACAALHCASVDENNILSELCVTHVATLVKFLNSHLRPYELSLTNVTTSLVDAVIASQYRAPRDRDRLLSEIKHYVECYIGDENLSPQAIATAFEISTRYVHKLFAIEGTTIGEWILNRRLDRSAEDLLQTDSSVTDIAFKWGFKALGHYSRTFKARFRMAPSLYRVRRRPEHP